jgi:hypothetical protein
MFTIPITFIDYNQGLYILKRVIKESSRPILDDWKEHLNIDTVLKKDGLLYFLQKVEEAQIIEENDVKLGEPVES